MPRKKPTKSSSAHKNTQPAPEHPIKTQKPAPKISIKPRTENQKKYLETIRNNDLAFGIGSAGTGKSYLTVASALQSLQNKEFERIVFVRPAVESGEKLGFLPGSLEEKVTPYLIPLLDAAKELLPKGGVDGLLKSGTLELATLAFMRGRSISNSFIILDEAQNTTVEQLIMAVTRIGEGSKMVITGDPSQVDLPPKVTSGLTCATAAFPGIDRVGFCVFDESDVVRHPLVGKLVAAHRIWKEKNVK